MSPWSNGRYVLDDRDDWSEHQPSADQENRYLEEHGPSEYGRWFLGADDEHDPDRRVHYKYPYGDFEKVHRCGVLSAESRAGQYKHEDVKPAAAHLPRHARGARLSAAGSPFLRVAAPQQVDRHDQHEDEPGECRDSIRKSVRSTRSSPPSASAAITSIRRTNAMSPMKRNGSTRIWPSTSTRRSV